MRKLRMILFSVLLILLMTLCAILVHVQPNPPFYFSFAPLLQEIGKPVKFLHRVVNRSILIDEVDEKILATEIKNRWMDTHFWLEDEATKLYLNSLIKDLTTAKKSCIEYEAYLVKGAPNAFALLGGVICVTTGLIEVLENEAELVSILAHEIGHCERGHCLDAVKAKIILRKLQLGSIGDCASVCMQCIGSICFNKTQENEADEYAFCMLLKKNYDPLALSTALTKLKKASYHDTLAVTYPIDDFFKTHPHIELRIEKFRSQAERWWQKHSGEKRYLGRRNFIDKKSLEEISYSEEWISR